MGHGTVAPRRSQTIKIVNYNMCPEMLYFRVMAFTTLKFTGTIPRVLEDTPMINRQHIHFLHDGAPAHFIRTARRYLDRKFTDRWIGAAERTGGSKINFYNSASSMCYGKLILRCNPEDDRSEHVNKLHLTYRIPSRRAASAAELAVKKKVNKYAHVLDNYIFVPFAVETFGPWSHDAKVLVSQIGQILISITGDRRCTTYLRQRLSIAIQRGNAMSVLGSLPESNPLDELFFL
ncbi:hypothetical protein ANN_15129 [Periplaneta americana]|uniref:Uncharacterized protein n=1 Tax=Periplaneta americana TaxID=6978 RepID=A0ABQ8SZU8_PERAM|nr:hypothetical protein ANN_15129 [Periplaneta americana]